jgi:CRISPR-associated protein Csm1
MNHDELLQTTTRIALTCLLKDVSQFAESATTKQDDFLSKAASAHQIHADFLQAIITVADLVASGFDPETDNSKQTSKPDSNQQVTLFEQIYNDGEKSELDHFGFHYKPEPLSPSSIFPVAASQKTQQAQYQQLCRDFMDAVRDIPKTHRDSLPLWLDHFDSCWQTYAHNIPSTTALGVSLYDHSKTVAALAVALWLYHKKSAADKTNPAATLNSRNDWQEQKLLLVQGDFFGIQAFIFAKGGDSTKKAAKLLRGRSFYVSLMTECAALLILEALHLPSTSQIINASGKFVIVAPNTPATIDELEKLQKKINRWFLTHNYGQSGLGLAWEAASCADFISTTENPPFQALKKRLESSLEKSKYQHFDLCGETAEEDAPPVFKHYLDSFNNEYGVCQLNDKAPAINKDKVSKLAQDQINIGTWIIKKQRLIISQKSISNNSLQVPLFGYHIYFTAEEDKSGEFSKQVKNGNIRRIFDFSPPESDTKALWNGYARRNISGYVPYFKQEDEWHDEKYLKFLADDDLDAVNINEPKLLNHLALENVDKIDGNWYGIKALAVLKGDIDDLGAIFQHGLKQPNLAKMAALSRQVNNFFAVYLPYLCQKDFPNTYIVFAGGDDFFLLGSWHQLIELAKQIKTQFQDYVANNPEIHFSAGLTVMNPKIPIYQLAKIAEESLQKSKRYNNKAKNAVTCFGVTVDWEDFEVLTTECLKQLTNSHKKYKLSTAYIYGLLRLVDMAEDNRKPENSLWRSQLYYRSYRTILSNKEIQKEQKKAACVELINSILANDTKKMEIKKFQSGYQITLHAHLYTHRKQA